MASVLSEMWRQIAARPSGPMAIRLYLQPIMATLIAVHDGIKDARRGRSPYFWALFKEVEQRRARMREGWRSIWKVFMLAVVLDVIYELIVLKTVRPVESALVACMLAIVPYLVVRGPANRIARRIMHLRRHEAPTASH